MVSASSEEIQISSLAHSVVVYTIRGNTTYMGDPTQKVRRDLAASQGLACPFVNVEAVKWLGPHRFLLRADLFGGRDCDSHNLSYEVDADSGQIKRFPASPTPNP